MTREELRDYVDEQRTLGNIPYHVYTALIDGIDTLEQEPTTKNNLGVDCIVDVLGSYTDLDIPYKREIAENILAKLSSVTPQEPRSEWEQDHAILKAYSDGVNEILDKIRAEIENDWQLKKYPSSPFSCGLRRAIEIIDKYKAESEVQDANSN